MSERQKLLDLLGQRGLWPDKARQMVDNTLYEFAHELAEDLRVSANEYVSEGWHVRALGIYDAAELIDPEVP